MGLEPVQHAWYVAERFTELLREGGEHRLGRHRDRQLGRTVGENRAIAELEVRQASELASDLARPKSRPDRARSKSQPPPLAAHDRGHRSRVQRDQRHRTEELGRGTRTNQQSEERGTANGEAERSNGPEESFATRRLCSEVEQEFFAVSLERRAQSGRDVVETVAEPEEFAQAV